jgi:hypothetical protein
MDPTLPPILAAGDAPPDGTLSIEASMTLEAAPDGQMGGGVGVSKGKGPPRFSMLANTGNPMSLAGWKFPVVVDFAGLNIPSQSRPIRFNHDGAGRRPHRPDRRRGRQPRRRGGHQPRHRGGPRRGAERQERLPLAGQHRCQRR